jgi:hypothetical protein
MAKYAEVARGSLLTFGGRAALFSTLIGGPSTLFRIPLGWDKLAQGVRAVKNSNVKKGLIPSL